MASITLSRALMCCAAAVLPIALPSAAQAVTVYSTTLLGINENPPLATSGMGVGTLTLADDMNSFSVLITFSGLSSNAVAGHVHCCAPVGSNAAVAIGFTVPSATAGTISGTYDLTQASTYNAPFLTSSGGTVIAARAAFLAGLSGGLAYLNVHTVRNPGGEIRGQLAAAAVPELSSWALMLAGFGTVGAGARLRRRKNTVVFA